MWCCVLCVWCVCVGLCVGDANSSPLLPPLPPRPLLLPLLLPPLPLLFEQGPWQRADNDDNIGAVGSSDANTPIDRIPVRRSERQEEEYQRMLRHDARLKKENRFLGVPQGLLVNELRFAPEATLKPLMEMFTYTMELSGAGVHSADATFILFVIKIAVHCLTYVVYACDTPGFAADASVEALLTLYRRCVCV